MSSLDPEEQAGAKVANLLDLPEDEQKLVSWLMRQKSVSLAEMVDFMQQDEVEVTGLLNSLVQQGFIQEVEQDGERLYRSSLAPKKGSRAAKNVLQSLDFE